MQTPTRQQIERFLACRRIAIVGVSRDSRAFSRQIFDEFIRRGFDVVPVNPNAESIADVSCYPRLTSIEPGVEAALVMTPRDQAAQVCGDAILAGIPRLWLFAAIGQGSVDSEAAARCRDANIDVIEGCCPRMFLEDKAWPCQAHGALLWALGKYPADA